jgi:flagellar basal-body rod protein FlgG
MGVRTLYTAGSGMQVMEDKLDVIANNLANIETTAFKRGRANFEDMFYFHQKLPGAEDSAGQYTPTGISIGMGARLQSVQTDLLQGTLMETGNELDIAIQGGGYLKVTDPATSEIIYTRSGNLSVNSQGNLCVASASIGRLVDPPITIPQEATKISISSEGIVSVQLPNNTQLQQVGQLELVQFINPEGLLKLGENLYRESDASGTPQTANPGQQNMGTIQQGYLEASNVQAVDELIDLIKTQRAFELNSQMVQAGDQILQNVANLRRY